jgi:hypothetical protein
MLDDEPVEQGFFTRKIEESKRAGLKKNVQIS